MIADCPKVITVIQSVKGASREVSYRAKVETVGPINNKKLPITGAFLGVVWSGNSNPSAYTLRSRPIFVCDEAKRQSTKLLDWIYMKNRYSVVLQSY